MYTSSKFVACYNTENSVHRFGEQYFVHFNQHEGFISFLYIILNMLFQLESINVNGKPSVNVNKTRLLVIVWLWKDLCWDFGT